MDRDISLMTEFVSNKTSHVAVPTKYYVFLFSNQLTERQNISDKWPHMTVPPGESIGNTKFHI